MNYSLGSYIKHIQNCYLMMEIKFVQIKMKKCERTLNKLTIILNVSSKTREKTEFKLKKDGEYENMIN